jgi:3-methyladenine DNA glycosylase AlkD
MSTIQSELRSFAAKARAIASARFFKTGKGEYGEGDVFLGITVPNTRIVAKRHYKTVTDTELIKLLQSTYHEERLLALIMLVYRYEATKDAREHKRIFTFYIRHRQYINNWDLVDTSAASIVGHYLYTYEGGDITVLTKCAQSKLLWERRIAVIACFFFIKQGESKQLFAVGKYILNDTHDLMHKAYGWMLREVYTRVSAEEVEQYLIRHIAVIPRTTLRYAIEKMTAHERATFLSM